MFRFPAAFASTSTLIQQRHVVSVLNHSNNKIDKSYPMKDRDGIDTDTKIIDFQIIAKNTVKIIVNHESIYNKVTASWQTVAVEFIFKKV